MPKCLLTLVGTVSILVQDQCVMIGASASAGGGSVAVKDVPPNIIFVGNPVCYLRSVEQ